MVNGEWLEWLPYDLRVTGSNPGFCLVLCLCQKSSLKEKKLASASTHSVLGKPDLPQAKLSF